MVTLDDQEIQFLADMKKLYKDLEKKILQIEIRAKKIDVLHEEFLTFRENTKRALLQETIERDRDFNLKKTICRAVRMSEYGTLNTVEIADRIGKSRNTVLRGMRLIGDDKSLPDYYVMAGSRGFGGRKPERLTWTKHKEIRNGL